MENSSFFVVWYSLSVEWMKTSLKKSTVEENNQDN